jgi:glycosyltransferase involved in cell wall biosynthesis
MVSSETNPSFSVVIPSYNSTRSLPLTLASVQPGDGVDVEVIVVDDGSTDDCELLYAEIAATGVRVIRNTINRGPGHARNLGARETHGDWLLFLDSDDTLLPGAFESFASVAGPSVGLIEGSSQVDNIPGVRRSFLAGSFVIRRDLFNAVGGYDEELRYSENSELSWRLEKALAPMGLERRIIDDAVVSRRGVGESRNYDEARMRAAIRILDTHADRMSHQRDERARHEAIAAVNAARIDEWSIARRYALRAVRSQPRDVRNYVRLTAFLLHIHPRTSEASYAPPTPVR